MFSPLKMRAFGVTAALLLCVHQCAAVLKELHSVTDSISYTKSAETVVIGIFQDKKSDQFKMFKQLTEDLDAGIAYGFSAAAEVIDKYVGEPGAPEELPFVVAFTPFDKETGKVKRGKKLKQYYSGKFEYPKLHEFVFRNALPLVIRLSDVEGPDQEKRNADSLRNTHPKILMFGVDQDVPADFMEAARSLYDIAFAYYTTANPKSTPKKDRGLALLKMLKQDPNIMKTKDRIVYFMYDKLEEYTEKLGDTTKVRKFFKDFLFGKPPYGAVPGKRTWKRAEDEL